MKDTRPHLDSMLMRESLIDKDLQPQTDTRVIRMLPYSIVVKIGARSIIDQGREVVYPLVTVIEKLLDAGNKLIMGTGGGARARHVFSIGIDLGLPTGVLAQMAMADALGNAHILGALLAHKGVVAIPPEMFGHLLPMFLHRAPGCIYNGVPPYSLWEHPPKIGKIPPHRTDAGCMLLAECFGSKQLIFVKDVNGLYDKDPHQHPDAKFIPEASVVEVEKMNLASLPFDRIILKLMKSTRLIKKFQIVNGHNPEMLEAVVSGENVGTTIYA